MLKDLITILSEHFDNLPSRIEKAHYFDSVYQAEDTTSQRRLVDWFMRDYPDSFNVWCQGDY